MSSTTQGWSGLCGRRSAIESGLGLGGGFGEKIQDLHAYSQTPPTAPLDSLPPPAPLRSRIVSAAMTSVPTLSRSTLCHALIARQIVLRPAPIPTSTGSTPDSSSHCRSRSSTKRRYFSLSPACPHNSPVLSPAEACYSPDDWFS